MLETMEAKFDEKRVYRKENTRGLATSTECQDNQNFKYVCSFCKKGHSLFYCADFLKLSVKDRISKIRQLQLCLNCLKQNHQARDCHWSGCKICKGKHNTILHESRDNEIQKSLTVTNEDSNANQHNDINDRSENETTSSEITHCALITAHNAILSTAKVQVRKETGDLVMTRALLDCGSQSSYITKNLCKQLNLRTAKVDVTVSGINNKTSHVNQKCNIVIFSTANSYSFNLSCYVIDEITNALPEEQINCTNFNIPVNIQLADPEFYIPKAIDILIGADAFWQLLSVGKVHLGAHAPILQNTRLGWLIAGTFNVSTKNTTCGFIKSKESHIQDILTKFWEVEEVSTKFSPLSAEELLCEKHFSDNLKITDEGRYMVAIPLKVPPEKLGDSRNIAVQRFLNLERRLSVNDKLRRLYIEFLAEYQQLGHMTKIQDEKDNSEYYMPHHGVMREDSETTKLRVVFNASSPTSTGVSFNDLQMTGPTIQQDLQSILLRFRTYPVILSSDIKMMYRQVLINPEQRNLQKIVWRSDKDKQLETFQLNTVTYGTTAASFLAIRCLHQLAEECQNGYPKIAKIIREDMYVDDLLTGANSVDEAKYICQKISEIFLTRKFELHKWKSNKPVAVSGLKADELSKVLEFSTKENNFSKTLGLVWLHDSDTLKYKISPNISNINTNRNVTKRSILSQISTVFDPLGLISPCIIKAKTLLQSLWAEKLSWDQNLPSNISDTWREFATEISILNDLDIKRKVIGNDPKTLTLHGFADASTLAYGACVYVVSVNCKGERESNLLCAKSKVAPLKPQTIPRLELCSALVLAQLITKVLDSMGNRFNNIYCWSDSTIVLGWLRTPPNLLKQFVNNRVAEIQRLTSSFEWKHVPSKENPADLISRGVPPLKLIECDLWWFGPHWLLNDSVEWPTTNITVCDLPERRTQSLNVTTKYLFPFERFSTLGKIKRCLAYVRRFIENCKNSSDRRLASSLAANEIKDSLEILIKLSQQESFPEDYARLIANKALSSNSKILSLNPFVDKFGILRVGGRLANSLYPYSKKHPILMSTNHHLTKLIFESEHKALLHAGPQLLLSHIREMFWPIAGRNFARKIVRNCIICARFNAHNVQPIMGDLPAVRVQPSLPFTNVGVDFAGPFTAKERTGRGGKTVKVWVSLFVCLSTRAIHLELVPSLSTEAFLQAFHRFISRRGRPAEVFSDNGTNFVKANKELQSMFNFVQDNSSTIIESTRELGITWHFIPPNSPHFGGIWEAGVKSLKYHLKRVMSDHILTYHDFQTLILRIEAVLNSRPLCPLSSDPADITPLSPAHFLIGRPLHTVPEPSLEHLPENRLSKFQLLQELYRQFWTRWSREYIVELQRRNRWKQNCGELKLGQLVLVKDSNLPPMKWRLGRVVNLVPGRDGVNRVAAVKTSDGILSRAVVRLCPLPEELQAKASKAGGMFRPNKPPLCESTSRKTSAEESSNRADALEMSEKTV